MLQRPVIFVLALAFVGLCADRVSAQTTGEARALADRIYERVADQAPAKGSFGLLVRFEAKPGKASKLAALYAAQAARASLEPGCLVYDVMRDAANPLIFRLYQRWRGLEAFRIHEYANYTLELFTEGAPLIATDGRELTVIEFVEPVAVTEGGGAANPVEGILNWVRGSLPDETTRFTLAVEITAAPGQGEAVAALYAGHAAISRREEGVGPYEVGRDAGSSDRLLLHESYADFTVFERHVRAPHTQAFIKASKDLIEARKPRLLFDVTRD